MAKRVILYQQELRGGPSWFYYFRTAAKIRKSRRKKWLLRHASTQWLYWYAIHLDERFEEAEDRIALLWKGRPRFYAWKFRQAILDGLSDIAITQCMNKGLWSPFEGENK